MTLMERRRALMVGKKSAPIALIDGSYDSGKIIITNGNHAEINSPSIYVVHRIPLTEAIDINIGDTVYIMVSGNQGPKSRYYGVVFNGTVYRTESDKPVGNTWIRLLTAETSGTITDVTIRGNEGGFVASIDISLKVGDEVIF